MLCPTAPNYEGVDTREHTRESLEVVANSHPFQFDQLFPFELQQFDRKRFEVDLIVVVRAGRFLDE